MEDLVELSMCSMEFGGALFPETIPREIETISKLVQQLDLVFASNGAADHHHKLLQTLQNVNLTTTEVNKYTFW